MYLHTKPKNSCQIFLSKRCRLFGGPVVRTSMTLCFCRRLVLFSSALKNISSQFRLLCIHGPPHDCSLRICLVVLRGERERRPKHETAKLIGKFHFVFQRQTVSGIDRPGCVVAWPVRLLCLFFFFFCSAHHRLAACHPDHSQEPSRTIIPVAE